MFNMKTKTIILTLALFIVTDARAGLLYTYRKLALMDLDQMNAMVTAKISESKKSDSGKIVPLKEALQAVLGRPNDDGMVEKVMAPLKSELEGENAWDKTTKDLVQEAINALKNPKNFQPDVQVTYAVFLENILAEIKPLANGAGFERKLVEKIRDAKIEISKEAQKERLKMMKSNVSPSEMADLILKTPPPAPVAAEESGTETKGENKSTSQNPGQ